MTAIYFDSASFSFIRNLEVTACGMYSGGNNSASIGIGRPGYVSGNIRVSGGQSNVVANVESSYSSNRGIWAQTQKLVVFGGSYHHNDADGIDLDSSSSHCTIHNASFYMNARCGVFLEFSASYNTIVGCVRRVRAHTRTFASASARTCLYACVHAFVLAHCVPLHAAACRWVPLHAVAWRCVVRACVCKCLCA